MVCGQDRSVGQHWAPTQRSVIGMSEEIKTDVWNYEQNCLTHLIKVD